MRLYYTISGSGEIVELPPSVDSFAAATARVRHYDNLVDAWVAEPHNPGRPCPKDHPQLWGWEGCDVYLEDENGGHYTFVEEDQALEGEEWGWVKI